MITPDIIPKTVTPAALAEAFGVSPKAMRDEIKAIGCYHKFGGKMVLTRQHVAMLMEATECQSQSTSAVKSTTSGALLMGSDYAALQALRTKKPRNASHKKLNVKSGDVISMARGPM